MIWLLYILLHSIGYAYFNMCFITGVDFHTAQVIALSIDIFAIFFFMRYPYKLTLYNIFWLVFTFCIWRWVFFDVSLNIMLGKGILYVGSGWLDIHLGANQYILKAILLIISVVLWRKQTSKT